VASDELGPEEVLDLKDRAARAADFVSQLSETERDVVAVMATRGAGLKLTARTLGMPVKTVKSAERSARAKLDRVALIAAAGRMCQYRERPIIAYARGSADPEVERVARTHLAACAPCRNAYAKLVREMRARDFQRDAAAAFLPVPAISLDHHFGLIGRMLGWLTSRPRVGGDRVAEALGGAGAVKVAAAGSAVVVATATLAGVSPPILPHTTPKSSRKHAAIHSHSVRDAAAGNPVTAIVAVPSRTTAAGSRVQPAPTRLTPREHAELEFSSLRSPHSGAGETYKRPSASIAEVHTSTQSAGAEPRGASEGGSSAVSSGASQAAREFGQP
jgi:DNA-binding CsgD family transcriptional regulator